jgi:hypothetical protein
MCPLFLKNIMKFSNFGATINSHEIVKSITLHGIHIFHTSEMHIKPFLCRKSACNLADIIAVYKRSGRFYIVGIEIKEWKTTVHPKIAMEYLNTYRSTCEYFYLAAKSFSSSTFDIEDIGLFDLTEMKVIKAPCYLSPNPDFRANLMKRIKKQFKLLYDAVDDPYQRTLMEF